MTDNNDAEHANLTNPCVGICVSDDNNMCIGCFRTREERDTWYDKSNEWRESVLKELPTREDDVFGKSK